MQNLKGVSPRGQETNRKGNAHQVAIHSNTNSTTPKEVKPMTDEKPEEPKPLEVTIKKEKETPYDGEESYQYENLNPTDEELAEDFDD